MCLHICNVKQETHHAMKKILYSILFLFAFIGAVNAQVLPNDFYISGQVTRSSDNTPIANKLVEVWRDTINGSGGGYYATANTNNSGNYNFYITNGSVVGPNQVYKVRVYDCQNFGNVQTTQNNQGTIDIAQLNFSICDNSNLCQANFDITTNYPSLDVDFNNTSTVTTGQISSSFWDFGDGTTSGNNPNISTNHAYDSTGIFVACLTITTTAGCTSTYCDTVYLISNTNCQTAFTVTPQVNNTFTFIPASSGTAPFTYTWNFGDGPNATSSASITHTYTTPGSYTVCVYATDANGCISNYCQQVTVTNTNCNASFNPTLLNNTFTYNLNPTTPGGTWTITPGSFLQPDPNGIVTFPNAGLYSICYTAPGNNGTSCTLCDSLVVGNPNGGCTAGFTTQPNGNDSLGWVFVGTFDGQVNNQATYTWDFGDGNTGVGGPTTQHYYQTPGIYNVCVIVSYNGCTATYCNVVYAGGNINGGCDASFTFTDANLLNSYVFIPVNNGNTYSHLWDFGDGTQSTQQSPIHTFTGNGIYLVCHTLFNNNGCQDTECYNITVNDSSNTGCQAYFYANPVNNSNDLNIQFTDYSTSGEPNNGIIGWTWSFGDGSSSTLQNPTHDYATGGSYVVCLTVWNNSGCQSTYCDSLVVGGGNNPNIISGTVYTSVNTTASVAYVFLLRFDYPNSELVPAGAEVTNNGNYVFSNVANGDYVVKAALTPNDPLYAVRIPTYHTAALLWNFGDVISINNNSYTTGDIYMIAASNNGGPGFIGGSVDWADTLRAAADFSGATVILQTIAGDNIAYTTADTDGNYSFNNLAYGTYKLYADFPGYSGDPTFVTLTPIADSVNNAQILLGPATITSVEETSAIDGVTVFPNPTTDNATLMVETSKTAQLNLTIVNMVGQVVDSQTVNAFTGKNMVQLNTNGLAQGVYTIVLRDSKGVAKVQRLIKQ